MSKNGSVEKEIWLIAGERSGDLYGAALARTLRAKSGAQLKIRGMGSSLMREAGVDLMVDSSELAVMGFMEVLTLLPKFIGVMNRLMREAKTHRPDLVVVIDFPGFNLRLAERLHKIGVPVLYYISPKVWSWKASRIKKMAAYCEKVLCIFPFETEFFAHCGTPIQTVFTGNPLIPILREKLKKEVVRDPERILILPGSRGSEIKHCFTRMIPSIRVLHARHAHYRWVIAASDAKRAAQITRILERERRRKNELPLPEIEIQSGQTLPLIQSCGTALATSGTVTLECAIAGLPLVSIYAGTPLSFAIARRLVKLYRNFFTLPNIIADKCLYEEYLQFCIEPALIVPAMERILPHGERRDYVIEQIGKITELLEGGNHDPIGTAVEVILSSVK